MADDEQIEEKASSPARRVWLWPTVIVVASVLGLQNGIWSYFTEPLLVRVRDVVLNVLSFGVSVLKDQIYLEIAKGSDVAASMTFTIVAAGMAFFFMDVISKHLRLLTKAEALYGKLRTDGIVFRGLDKVFGGPTPELRLRRLRWIVYPNIVLMSLFVLAMFGMVATQSYQATARGHYYQMKAIVAPHVDAAQLLEFESRFAMIHTADDYTQLIRDLESLAIAKKLYVPSFSPW